MSHKRNDEWFENEAEMLAERAEALRDALHEDKVAKTYSIKESIKGIEDAVENLKKLVAEPKKLCTCGLNTSAGFPHLISCPANFN